MVDKVMCKNKLIKKCFGVVLLVFLLLNFNNKTSLSYAIEQYRCFDGCSTKCFAGTSKYDHCKSDCNRRCFKDFY